MASISKNSVAVERQFYISIADTKKLLEFANPTWRTIVALSRLAGLRCPSEVLSLKWEYVDFASSKMTVSSPKTEHIEGKAFRVVPIFAPLRPYLEDAFELAEPGEVYVVGGAQGAAYRATSQKPGGWGNTNLRTTFEKLIRRAGLNQWPKLFHNLRASLETDLMQEHPIHVVTAWVGNSPRIALGHYLQTLDTDFAKAVKGYSESGAKSGAVVVQNAVQTRSDPMGLETTEATGSLENQASRRFAFCSWAGWESNPLPTRYEQAARPLSFRPRPHQFSFPMVRCNGSQAFVVRTTRKPMVFVGRSGCCALREALRHSAAASTQLPPRMTFKSPPTGPVGSVPAVSK